MDTVSVFSITIALLSGSIVGALAVYYTSREKLKKLRQLASIRRITTLEQVAQHVGKVSHVFGKYLSVVSEIGPQANRISTRQGNELDELSNELVAVYEEISIAESKLLLLGERRLEKAMKLYTAKMAQYRKKIYPGRYKSQDEAGKIRQDISSMRSQFYDILSERYDQLNLNRG